jgi:conjugal transfer pilus assembly protein TraB
VLRQTASTREGEQPAGEAANGSQKKSGPAGARTSSKEEDGFLPVSIISGTLLTGMDAATGKGARADPIPILLRVKHEAILPNRFTVDIRECFLIASGYGDLSSERAYLRAENLSCVRDDDGVIETTLEAYAVGEDGKAGIRGRLVSKQGAVLVRAMQAGFLEAFASMFRQQPVATISTGRVDRDVQYQSNLTPQAVGSAALAGVGSALDRLAQFYLDMAEDMFPVIEVDAGRQIDFIVHRGQRLRLTERAH